MPTGIYLAHLNPVTNAHVEIINDLLEEKDLPSVEGYIEKEEEIEEEVQTLEDANGETFAEVKDIVPPWPELLRLVNDLKESIPEIPEIKSYDNELQELLTQIEQVRENIPEVPEVRYYEDQIEALKEDIDGVRSDIPKFPKWVNEVNEVPDFSWIGKTFSVIDDDFEKVKANHVPLSPLSFLVENSTEQSVIGKRCLAIWQHHWLFIKKLLLQMRKEKHFGVMWID